MRPLLPSHGFGEEEADVAAGSADRTGEEDRIIKIKQMIKMTISSAGAAGKAQLERAFRDADKDASGLLSYDELAHALKNDFAVKGLTPGDIRRLFAAMDADASGSVSCDEFLDAIEAVPFATLRDQVREG